MGDELTLLFQDHLSKIPKAFQDLDCLKAGWLYERKIKGPGVSIEKGAEYPSVSLSFAGIDYPERTQNRILTEVLRCNGEAGCSPGASVKYSGCSVILHIVHYLDRSEIWMQYEHGPKFKPGSFQQRGLTREVSYCFT